MIQFVYQPVPIPTLVKSSLRLLFFAIGSQILRCFLRARCTIVVLFAFAIATLAKIFTSFWSWSNFDGYPLVFGLVAFYIGFPVVQVVEEFCHAAVPIVKNRPEWLKDMLVANLYSKDKKTIWLFLFVAIQHQGKWSPLDSFHISAAGPLGVLAIGVPALIIILVCGILTGTGLLYPALALAPFLLNGLLSLVPIRAAFGSDGANMVKMARQLNFGLVQFLQESFRSVELIVGYMIRHGLARVRVGHIILLITITFCGLLLNAS